MAAPPPNPPLEVRCAGCGETLEVEPGLTEFICPDCHTPQALPPELMPRRRKALPLPRGVDSNKIQLPCASCDSLLNVPHGLSCFACPKCGVDLAVDPERLTKYLASSSSAAVAEAAVTVVTPSAVQLASAIDVEPERSEQNNVGAVPPLRPRIPISSAVSTEQEMTKRRGNKKKLKLDELKKVVSPGRRLGLRSMSNIGGSSTSPSSSNTEKNIKRALIVKRSPTTPDTDLPTNEDAIDVTVDAVDTNEQTLPETNTTTPTSKKRGRGSNLCKGVMNLGANQKLSIEFYNNRAVGKNHNEFSRYLGKIVRDRNYCPVCVHKWSEIREQDLDRMWAAVTDKFEHKHMEAYRGATLRHMKCLWSNWRADLLRWKIKKWGSMDEALKHVPDGMDKTDWEWLIKEHFSSKKFIDKSDINRKNRAKSMMPPHRTGSKPLRQLIYKQGGEDSNPPDAATVFFESRKKGDTIQDPEALNKYVEMVAVSQSDPSLSDMEVINKCFGKRRRRGQFMGRGSGSKAKQSGDASIDMEWETHLKCKERENEALRSEMMEMRAQMNEMKEKTEEEIKRREEEIKEMRELRAHFSEFMGLFAGQQGNMSL